MGNVGISIFWRFKTGSLKQNYSKSCLISLTQHSFALSNVIIIYTTNQRYRQSCSWCSIKLIQATQIFQLYFTPAVHIKTANKTVQDTC